MAKELKILSIRRVSFQKDMIQRGVQGRIETEKQADGSFKAKYASNNLEAIGKNELEAVQNLKKIVQDQLTKGDFSGITTKTV